MPRQLTFLGRPIPRIPPKRVAILLAATAIFALFTLLFTLPSSIPTGPSLSKFADTHVPGSNLWKSFKDEAHEPPVQKNSSSGESSWFSDWKWLKPYSSQITLDENRSLLPPLLERPAIYTYYDHTKRRSDVSKEDDEALKVAENKVLVTWRRAWWAQGFKPIILGPAEAMKNPHSEELQRLELDDGLKNEMLRWLAWESMGTGILCNYMTLPMGAYNDPLLTFLRRGSFPVLTRYEGLGSGLFAGDQSVITAAVKAALANGELKSMKDLISAVPPATFQVDPQHDSIAYYNDEVLKSKYPAVANAFGSPTAPTVAKGFESLNELTNAHLHNTWQNQFSQGIAVLKPGRIFMNALLEPALQLAKLLAQCSTTNPVPSSCPPNVPNAKCKPCVASHPMIVTTPENIRNKTDLYEIGIVPHPYTYAMLSSGRESINVSWIRAVADRDPWLNTVTKVITGAHVSGPPRVLHFKSVVASSYGFSRSLWMTAEKDIPEDLDWRFGFAIPRDESDTGKSETPVPGPERRPKVEVDFKDMPLPTETDLEIQQRLIGKAKDLLEKTEGEKKRKEGTEVVEWRRVRSAIEMWNLADIEAWRFARAWLARGRVERLKWEEEERGFAGGMGADKGSGRWFD